MHTTDLEKVTHIGFRGMGNPMTDWRIFWDAASAAKWVKKNPKHKLWRIKSLNVSRVDSPGLLVEVPDED